MDIWTIAQFNIRRANERTGSFSKAGFSQEVILVLLNHTSEKKLINLILKKGKILGEEQYGSISADWIFRVVNFGFHYLIHFSIIFENSWADLAANFLNFSKHPKHFLFGWFLWKLWMKNQKCWRSENMPIWANPEIQPFLSVAFFNFFLFPVAQEYHNKWAPALKGRKKWKTYGKLPKITNL